MQNHLFNVLHANPPADKTGGSEDDNYQVVLWEERHFTEEEIASRLKQLYIYFPDHRQPINTTVEGELVLFVSPNLSKIRRVRLFNALGHPIKSDFEHLRDDLFSQLNRWIRSNGRSLLRTANSVFQRFRRPVRQANRPLASIAQRAAGSARSSGGYLNLAQDHVRRRDPLNNLMKNLLSRRPNLHQAFTHKEGSDVALYAVTKIRAKFSLPITEVVRNRKEICQRELRLERVIPNHTLIGEIVDFIANYQGEPSREYHIREVIENSPRVSRQHSSLDKRLWNISGRRYYDQRPYPIDFHIVISGSAYQGHVDRSEAEVMLSVQSTVSSEEMTQHVEDTLSHLCDMIGEAADNWRATPSNLASSN